MRRRRVDADREMLCFEAKSAEAATEYLPFGTRDSKSPPKSVLMTSSSELP